MGSNIERHRAAHELFNQRDWDAALALFASDASFEDRGRSITLKGPEQFIGWLQGWAQTFSDAKVTNPTYLDAGDTTVALFNGTGTNDGAMGPIQATGNRLDAPYCEVLTWNADGQIQHGEIYYDQVTILVQMGVMEAPAG